MSRPLAVITGASAGMGAEFARQIGARGYDLLLVARREDRLARIRDQVTAVSDIHCEVLPLDLTKDDDLLVLEGRLSDSPELTVLVNNAGVGSLGTFYEARVEEMDRMHRLHVIATMRLCHAALPGMMSRNRGGIINVSSVSAFVATAGSVSYSATKAWMNRFTEGLYLELRVAGSRVRVQALCPGYTRTEFHEAINMDVSRIPPWMWLSAKDVVRESLTSLSSGKLFVVPGRFYRTALRLYALLPASAKVQVGLGSAAFRKLGTSATRRLQK